MFSGRSAAAAAAADDDDAAAAFGGGVSTAAAADDDDAAAAFGGGGSEGGAGLSPLIPTGSNTDFIDGIPTDSNGVKAGFAFAGGGVGTS